MEYINQISDEIIRLIKEKTAYSLPSDCSKMSAQKIKEYFYRSQIDSQNSLIAEINRVIVGLNANFTRNEGKEIECFNVDAENKKIVIQLKDNTKIECGIEDIYKEFSGHDGENVNINISDNMVISAVLKDGSISLLKLDENLATQISSISKKLDKTGGYINGDLTIKGNIYHQGKNYEVQLETLRSTNDYLVLRDGNNSSLLEGQYTGIEANKYDGVNDGRLVFDNSGNARVGDKGNEQPLATRDEFESMENGKFVYWDSRSNKLKTSPNNPEDFSRIYAIYTTLNGTKYIKIFKNLDNCTLHNGNINVDGYLYC